MLSTSALLTYQGLWVFYLIFTSHRYSSIVFFLFTETSKKSQGWIRADSSLHLCLNLSKYVCKCVLLIPFVH